MLLALLTSSLLAQTAAVGNTDLSRGTNLLPNSVAFTDEATSLAYNPAGLGRVGTFNGWYVHEQANVRRQVNDGFWLATSIGNLVGLGVSFEWLRDTSTTERRKSSFGFSAGPQTFSLGATINWFNGGRANNRATIDLGFQSRPLRWLSLGGLVRNVNQQILEPAFTGVVPTPELALAREYSLGIGLRPFKEYVTLGVDWVVNERAPFATSRMQYTLQVKPVKGLRLLGGFSHAFAAGEPLYVHAGVGLDLDNVGYTQGVAYADGRLNWQFAGRFSLDNEPSLLPKKKLAVVSLSDLGGAPGGLTIGSLLGIGSEDRYLRFLRYLDRAARDSELEGIVLKVEGAGVGLARADEVREAIVKLRLAGKKVFAYVLNAGDPEYLMISACDGIYAAPEAMLQIDGLRSSITFLGGTAKRFGVDVEVARVGAYKNFPDQFTRSDMSDEQRETIEAYLDTNQRQIARRIEEGRKIAPAAWQTAVDEGITPPRRALELKQLDGVFTPKQFEEHLQAQLPGVSVARGYRPFDVRDVRWGVEKAIAVIPVLGSISGGKNSSTPLTGDLIAGAESFIEALGTAADDPAIAAIVIRVDSGGGDGLAADLMYRAVLEAKKKKPVIASMGDAAASGGYYVAMGADEIVASPTTLTGSIGVFYVKPTVKRLAEELGANTVSINRGKLAGMTDPMEPWSPEQRKAAQRWIDDFYDTFISEVASSRKMTKEAVDAVARGRVWSGEDAKAKGLVDHLGGLMDAVAIAQLKSGTTSETPISIYQGSVGLLPTLLGSSVLELELPSQKLPVGLQTLAEQMGRHAWILESPRVQARLEYTVEIR
jgi:protease-4